MAKKQKNNSINPVFALVGLITGVVAGAAAIFLSDKKNREKAKDVLQDMEKEGEKTVRQIGKKLSEVGKERARKKT